MGVAEVHQHQVPLLQRPQRRGAPRAGVEHRGSGHGIEGDRLAEHVAAELAGRGWSVDDDRAARTAVAAASGKRDGQGDRDAGAPGAAPTCGQVVVWRRDMRTSQGSLRRAWSAAGRTDPRDEMAGDRQRRRSLTRANLGARATYAVRASSTRSIGGLRPANPAPHTRRARTHVVAAEAIRGGASPTAPVMNGRRPLRIRPTATPAARSPQRSHHAITPAAAR